MARTPRWRRCCEVFKELYFLVKKCCLSTWSDPKARLLDFFGFGAVGLVAGGVEGVVRDGNGISGDVDGLEVAQASGGGGAQDQIVGRDIEDEIKRLAMLVEDPEGSSVGNGERAASDGDVVLFGGIAEVELRNQQPFGIDASGLTKSVVDGCVLKQELESGVGKRGGMGDSGVFGAEMLGGFEDLGERWGCE
jgi:hypothetical protein